MSVMSLEVSGGLVGSLGANGLLVENGTGH